MPVPDAPASVAIRCSSHLTIGLLNNLGDGGIASSQRQFLRLIERSRGSTQVRIRLFSLPSIRRNPDARAWMRDRGYEGLDDLMASGVDGLIVTGAEPLTDNLRDEAFWPEIAAVIDWAGTGTLSTVWSCLAAHAAVLRTDGVERRRLGDKCTGVFPVSGASGHPLLAGAGHTLQVCHSRWNALDESDLVAAGYEIVTRGAMGVDAFVKRRDGGLHVFLQGHPEYDRDTLGRELLRDITRWRSNPERVPAVPANYFAASSELALKTYIADADPVAIPFLGPPSAASDDLAITVFRNWLKGLKAARRADALRPAHPGGSVESNFAEEPNGALAQSVRVAPGRSGPRRTAALDLVTS